jgi:hypothetical protein
MKWIVLSLVVGSFLAGRAVGQPAAPALFGSDLDFLKKNTDVIVLSDKAGAAQLAVAPAYQGRVMTSTAEGAKGLSFGWINRELIAEHQFRQHINAWGGEDRFWLGPEGGQFALFFAPGVPFDLEHWFTPAPIDTEPFEVVSKTDDQARFTRKFTLTNYSGTKFDVAVDRTVRLLPADEAWKKLGVAAPPGVKLVAFETLNKITNAGPAPWKKDTGLVSIWILGMFNPSPTTTIVIPIQTGPEAELGPAVNADYFGPVPPDRLVVKDGVVYFSGDGKYRSKIGISPKRAKPVLGSYDATSKVLTLVQFTLPPGATDYVNSMWKTQEHPYAGDVANSYNDGPPAPGAKPLGPFFELEASSPAAALAPGQALEHVQRTCHLVGSEAELDGVAKAVLGVGVQQITTALPH